MKCPTHPEVEATAYCGQCGRPLCAECRRDVRGITYCENCLAARMHSSGLPPILGDGIGSQPGIALFLGFIPGVGAIYNGQVVKAIVQVLIFGSLIGLSDRARSPMDTIFGLGAAAFYFYMVIDSYQTARRKQLGQPAEEWLGIGDANLNAPTGAIVLILLGVLFLLDNLGVPIFADSGRFWPLLLIPVGVWLLQKKMRRHSSSPASGSGGQRSDSKPQGENEKEL